jgi:hypothetical protein
MKTYVELTSIVQREVNSQHQSPVQSFECTVHHHSESANCYWASPAAGYGLEDMYSSLERAEETCRTETHASVGLAKYNSTAQLRPEGRMLNNILVM